MSNMRMTRVGNTNRFVPIDEDARFEGNTRNFPYWLEFPVYRLSRWPLHGWLMWPEHVADELVELEEGPIVAQWRDDIILTRLDQQTIAD